MCIPIHTYLYICVHIRPWFDLCVCTSVCVYVFVSMSKLLGVLMMCVEVFSSSFRIIATALDLNLTADNKSSSKQARG